MGVSAVKAAGEPPILDGRRTLIWTVPSCAAAAGFSPPCASWDSPKWPSGTHGAGLWP
jgi:hypothetical protein